MVPFNIPPYTDNEIEYVGKAIDAHKISGDGEFTKLCSRSELAREISERPSQ